MGRGAHVAAVRTRGISREPQATVGRQFLPRTGGADRLHRRRAHAVRLASRLVRVQPVGRSVLQSEDFAEPRPVAAAAPPECSGSTPARFRSNQAPEHRVALGTLMLFAPGRLPTSSFRCPVLGSSRSSAGVRGSRPTARHWPRSEMQLASAQSAGAIADSGLRVRAEAPDPIELPWIQR